MVDSVSQGSTAGNFAAANSIASNGEDLSNMFLELLVAQISHQNPLDPSDGTEYVTQLAQFSSLESLQGIRENTAANQSSLDVMKVLETTQLVGREVSVPASSVVLEQDGDISGSVNLSAAAESVTAQLYDADGDLVAEQKLPYSGVGTLSFKFADQDAGQYSVRVQATQANGLSTGLTAWLNGAVERVSVGTGADDILLQVNGLGNFNLTDINQLVTKS
ncbi:LfgD [Shewanella sp. C32]|uniref:Basal-body rod modification protein FlgD n=1 Tax=Shewanella electrica TaxID=515560 RepID=A0ABT2FHA2_9GAMM|nr:flagellar hook capping FlgD N-terminal domain-containing protein [Shewanella electrica]MCH1923250.1 LfgD [Shewanella electrica]MCS4555347.1 LfgD [Shewanella electrica]